MHNRIYYGPQPAYIQSCILKERKHRWPSRGWLGNQQQLVEGCCLWMVLILAITLNYHTRRGQTKLTDLATGWWA